MRGVQSVLVVEVLLMRRFWRWVAGSESAAHQTHPTERPSTTAALAQMYTEAAPLVSYQQWVVRFGQIALAGLLAGEQDGRSTCRSISESGLFEEARELLLSTLSGAPLFEGDADPLENPPLPAAVAHVAADVPAAVHLLQELFAALFEADRTLMVYTVVDFRDDDAHPDLLAPLGVVVLCGPAGYQRRRVLYEGRWRLQELVAGDPGELYALYARMRTAVEECSSCLLS